MVSTTYDDFDTYPDVFYEDWNLGLNMCSMVLFTFSTSKLQWRQLIKDSQLVLTKFIPNINTCQKLQHQ